MRRSRVRWGILSWAKCLVLAGIVGVGSAQAALGAERAGARPLRAAPEGAFFPPAVPLVACDPYFSIWSPSDRLNEAATVHWTGRPHRLCGILRVDGAAYRVVGAEPAGIPGLEQKSLAVQPTRTVYRFEGAGVELVLTFFAAALPEDIDLLSRPVTYVSWDLRSIDGREHEVEIYFGAAAEICVNEPGQLIVWAEERPGDLVAAKIGSRDQPILAKAGDDLRIDWGYLYLFAPRASASAVRFGRSADLERSFVEGRFAGSPPQAFEGPPPAEGLAAAFAVPVGRVGQESVSLWLGLAYDDLYSIQYMGSDLRPYWRRGGWEAAARDYAKLRKRCEAFDAELTADLVRVGGERYARICALAYRQCLGANKFVADARGQPLSFSKECFSNGCIGTADVFYPMAPQFLLFGPSLAKSFLVPFLEYASSPRWKFPFAPHDLGTYPHANGQVYGGGERSEENQMPVEESGNLLILLAALAEIEGNADFAGRYWRVVESWAEYLKEKGYDPEHQLCTDDFAGHLAHNVNLSAKAICGLSSFAKLARLRGEEKKAAEYEDLARRFTARWLEEADDGDHFRLAFDRPGTWSQKYNIAWDRILGFGLWPEAALAKEMAFYRKVQNRYGLPLDNRSLYTKLDWVLWTATLTGKREDFEALVDPVYRFLSETPDRVPMTDWYWTHNARRQGFQARPVVGGVFLRMLYEKDVWRKWASRDATKASGWAPMPEPPGIVSVLPTAEEARGLWRYTTSEPPGGWFLPDFDDRAWKEGPGGFGAPGTPGAIVGTEWRTKEIWLRREFVLSTLPSGDLRLRLHHDEDAKVYLNGVLAADAIGYTTRYQNLRLPPEARAALRAGRNVIAIRCRQTAGGQYVDAGLVELKPAAVK